MLISNELFATYLPLSQTKDKSEIPATTLAGFEKDFVDVIKGSCAAETGFVLAELNSGKVVASHNSKVPMINPMNSHRTIFEK